MVLCRVNIEGVTEEDLVTINSYYVFPLEKPEIHEGYITMNAMGGGELCKGKNDFKEKCPDCRYHPEVVKKYLRKQKKFSFKVN